MRQTMITTSDNPFDPFDDFVNWFKFDHSKQYFTSELLARVVVGTNELSASDEHRMIEEGIDTLMRINPWGNFVKLIRE